MLYIENKRKFIWGKGDKDTLKLLKGIKIQGKWLNLAAGDGRYNLNLLKRADFVVALDIDKIALNKLWSNTPVKHRPKLKLRVFDITKKFPFKDNYFDGVFSTGTLHLLPRKILPKVLKEIGRVLKKNGRIIIDFAADIRRISFDGKFVKIGNEPLYTLREAKKILKGLFKGYKIKMYQSKIQEDIVVAKTPYKFSCKFIIIIADKTK